MEDGDTIDEEMLRELDRKTILVCEKIWSLFEVYNLPLLVYQAAILNTMVNVSLELELSVEEMRNIFQEFLIRYSQVLETQKPK